MAEHNLLGKEGEKEAIEYLLTHGYRICHRNWRSGRKELDIVAEKDNELIVIEVKTRRNNLFADPEEAVNNKKIRHIVAATDRYLKKFKLDLPVRFDIITVTGNSNQFEINHITDAFYPPIW